MKFDALINNQKKVIKLFHNSYKKDRLVHTYLFEGAKGTSKFEAAYYFAALILCTGEEKPCLHCEECRKILKEVHPSIFVVNAEGTTIKKEQVEALEKEFSLTAINGGKRVYIIKDIDKATASAANSLLKFLEEIGKDNYGILITENINNVLLTIRSRSQIVSFSQLPISTVANELMKKGVDEETSLILSNISNSVDDCLEMINDGKILDIIELVKKVGISIVSIEQSPILIMYQDGEFLLKESDKKYHNIFMDLLIALTRDKLFYLLNQIDRIIFKNTIEVVGELMTRNYEQSVIELESILSFKQRLKYNVNVELLYAQMLIEIARLK